MKKLLVGILSTLLIVTNIVPALAAFCPAYEYNIKEEIKIINYKKQKFNYYKPKKFELLIENNETGNGDNIISVSSFAHTDKKDLENQAIIVCRYGTFENNSDINIVKYGELSFIYNKDFHLKGIGYKISKKDAQNAEKGSNRIMVFPKKFKYGQICSPVDLENLIPFADKNGDRKITYSPNQVIVKLNKRLSYYKKWAKYIDKNGRDKQSDKLFGKWSHD